MLPVLLAASMVAAPACIPVTTDKILAGDMAAVVSGLASVPPETVLGYAPAPGVRRIFSTDELRRMVERYGGREIPDGSVCMEWPMALPSSEKMMKAMKQSLLATGTEDEPAIEIVESSQYAAPPGEVQFPVSGLAPGAGGDKPVTWRGFIRYSNGRKFQIWARIRVQAAWTRVVAAETIRSGEPIAPTQVRLERHESMPGANTARSLEEVVGKAARLGIRAGISITSNLLESPHDVRRGDTVRVESHYGNAHIVSEGRAENNGRSGDTISIRNPTTGRTYRARVEGTGRVVVGDASLD